MRDNFEHSQNVNTDRRNILSIQICLKYFYRKRQASEERTKIKTEVPGDDTITKLLLLNIFTVALCKFKVFNTIIDTGIASGRLIKFLMFENYQLISMGTLRPHQPGKPVPRSAIIRDVSFGSRWGQLQRPKARHCVES